MIERIKSFGADIEAGLARCMNDRDFYLELVQEASAEDKFPELEAHLKTKDYKAAFSVAHSLKGVYANLALTPLLEPVVEMTELLRAETDTDYSELLTRAKKAFQSLREICND